VTAFVARAPGKLFLLGEYAVLDGCPAVVAAVDRYVTVGLRLEDRSRTVRFTSADQGAVEFTAGAPPVVDGPLRFVVAAYRSALSGVPSLADAGAAVEIRSDLDTSTGAKTGLGSSAAVTVAVVAALYAAARPRCADSTFRAAVFNTALEAHRTAQHGVGSGGDVAASTHGGVCLIQPATNGDPPSVVPMCLPGATTVLAAWSGESASTRSLVQRYCAADSASTARAAFVAASRAAVERFVAGLGRGFLCRSGLEDCARALEQLGTDLALPLMTPRLRQLVALARQCGAAAKISGAGGGDCAIALAEDRPTAERTRAAWGAAGFTPLDLAISPEGVTVARS